MEIMDVRWTALSHVLPKMVALPILKYFLTEKIVVFAFTTLLHSVQMIYLTGQTKCHQGACHNHQSSLTIRHWSLITVISLVVQIKEWAITENPSVSVLMTEAAQDPQNYLELSELKCRSLTLLLVLWKAGNIGCLVDISPSSFF